MAGLAFAQTPELRKVDGKDLPVVPGPLTGGEQLRDPAGRMGTSPMDRQIRRSSRSGPTVPAVAV